MFSPIIGLYALVVISVYLCTTAVLHIYDQFSR